MDSVVLSPDQEKRRAMRNAFFYGPGPEEQLMLNNNTQEATYLDSSAMTLSKLPTYDDAPVSLKDDLPDEKPDYLMERYKKDDGDDDDEEVDVKVIAAEEKKNSNIQTLTNIIKANIGTGMLNLPHGFKEAGLAVGAIGTMLCGFLSTFCMHQLLGVYEKVGENKPMDYADLTEATFKRSQYHFLNKLATFARHVTNFFILATQFGTCCVYIVFCSRMVKDVVDIYFPEYAYIELSYYHWATTLALIPYCFVTTLYVLSLFCLLANAITAVCVCIIFYHVFANLQAVENVQLATGPGDFFVFFGSAMFSYSSVTFLLPLRRQMRTPTALNHWDGLLNLGMAIVMGLYTATGFYGYLCFGEDTVFMLRNLPDHWYFLSSPLQIIDEECFVFNISGCITLLNCLGDSVSLSLSTFNSTLVSKFYGRQLVSVLKIHA